MGLDLADVHPATVAVASTQSKLLLVAPGEPETSYLMHKMDGTHADVGGSGSLMPMASTPISEAERDIVRAWIADGALP